MEPDKILKRLEENSGECIIKNKRKTLDILFNTIRFSSILFWIFIFGILIICDEKMIMIFDINQKANIMNEYRNLIFVVNATLVFFGINFIMCIIALKRARRKSDEILKKSLMASEVVFAIIGILLLVKFI